MEVINFINEIKKKGKDHFEVWMPIVLKFQNDFIRIDISINENEISYINHYRIIKYGLDIFPYFVKDYTLKKEYGCLVLTKKNSESLNYAKEEIKKTTNAIVPKNQEKAEFSEIEKKDLNYSSNNNLDDGLLINEEENKIISEPKEKKKTSKKQETSYPNEIYVQIIEYLNVCTGKEYKSNSKINRTFITSRLNEGYTEEDFRKVITIKSKKWLNTSYEQFLRPQTLFSNKFESYLNENEINEKQKSNLNNIHEQISGASQLRNSQE